MRRKGWVSMGWKLTFHFEEFPKVVMYGFVTASNEQNALEKFKTDYPNLANCTITKVVPFEGE